jgi:hypothetical protein
MVLAFHFPSARRGCGNVGIAQRFPRAVERAGKPAFGFPGFPRAVISTVVPRLQLIRIATWDRMLYGPPYFIQETRTGVIFENQSARALLPASKLRPFSYGLSTMAQ